MTDMRAFIDGLLAGTGCGPGATIPILQGIQHKFRHLPEPALRQVSEATGIRLADLIGVATFYHQFRLGEIGSHTMRVCHGTACHVNGSENIHDHLCRLLQIPEGGDTCPSNEFTVERVACLGCCTIGPVVQIDHTTYGHLTASSLAEMVEDFRATRHETISDVDAIGRQPASRCGEIRVGLGSCCIAKGSAELFHRLRQTVRELGIDVQVKRVGCVGACYRTPSVEIRLPGGKEAFYTKVGPGDAVAIVRRHFRPPGLGRRLVRWVDRTLEEFVAGNECREMPDASEAPASAPLGRQVRIATEGLGEMDPLDLDEYLAQQGFEALRQALARPPEETLETIARSGLRGRGGAGFPTGAKWSRVRAAHSPDGSKHVIVNGDEGDPGAFMDGMLMESFPYRVIEGMLVAAWCVGAAEGTLYVRAEYPRSVARLRGAIRQMEERGLLGAGILGSKFHFKLQLFEGAGAFVCGEETALIESMEGRRGIPRIKPPYPADCGFWQRPTLINNVETFAMVPWIVRHGAEAFASLGTEMSRGTKVFSLAGKVVRAGLIEVPMGITIREIVEDIGGGAPEGKTFKAVQIGGPSGGCIPAALGHTSVDYEALAAAGAIMGSGGLIVLDGGDCMVDMARYFMTFLRDESCGQCTFCRIGTMRMYEILERFCQGAGRRDDFDEITRLADLAGIGSLCGLGRTAPNPVVTTLKYFRDEYDAHIDGRCPAGRCKPLIQYVIQDICTGCTLCAQRCPAKAIEARPYRRHQISDDLCTRCDVCRAACPENAIVIMSGGIPCPGRAHKATPAEPLEKHE
ncbi:MAG: NAD(P)H-dependent oxidoreductase subunit E [Verrucomicrobiae bacterium]